MNSDEFAGFLAGCFLSFTVMLIVLICSSSTNNSRWEKLCIEHGAAQYNPTTGVFEWKEKIEDAK